MNEYYNYSFITLTNKKLLSLSVSVNCEVLAWDLSCIQLHNVSQIPIFNENTEWWLPEFSITKLFDLVSVLYSNTGLAFAVSACELGTFLLS